MKSWIRIDHFLCANLVNQSLQSWWSQHD